MAAYNQKEEFLRPAIDSILSQNFKDYEFIVVDDGSTDRTPEILQSYGARIKIVRQENQGPEMAYKTGAAHAKGKYLAFLDSDDCLFPYALEVYDKIIQSQDSPPLIVGAITTFKEMDDLKKIDGDINTIEILKFRDYLSKDITIGLTQSRIVMQKSLFEDAYGKRETATPCFLNDYNMLLQVGIYGPCVIINQPITVAYRQHYSQGSLNVEKMGQGVFQLIEMVRSGQCSGGRSRLLSKYAFLGGLVYEWSKKAFATHRPGLALRLIMRGWPMFVVAIFRKALISFRGRTVPFGLETK
jgi:hypothetical protein